GWRLSGLSRRILSREVSPRTPGSRVAGRRLSGRGHGVPAFRAASPPKGSSQPEGGWWGEPLDRQHLLVGAQRDRDAPRVADPRQDGLDLLQGHPGAEFRSVTPGSVPRTAWVRANAATASLTRYCNGDISSPVSSPLTVPGR